MKYCEILDNVREVTPETIVLSRAVVAFDPSSPPMLGVPPAAPLRCALPRCAACTGAPCGRARPSMGPSRGGGGRCAYRADGRRAPTRICRRAVRVERGGGGHRFIHGDDTLARAAGGGGRSRGSGAVGATHDGQRAWGKWATRAGASEERRGHLAGHGVEQHGKHGRRGWAARSAPGGADKVRYRVKARFTNRHARAAPGDTEIANQGEVVGIESVGTGAHRVGFRFFSRARLLDGACDHPGGTPMTELVASHDLVCSGRGGHHHVVTVSLDQELRSVGTHGNARPPVGSLTSGSGGALATQSARAQRCWRHSGGDSDVLRATPSAQKLQLPRYTCAWVGYTCASCHGGIFCWYAEKRWEGAHNKNDT